LTRLSEKPGNIVSAVDSLLKNSNSENEEQRDIATLGEFLFLGIPLDMELNVNV